MKDSIKRAQSRAGSSFAERENQRSLAGGESNFRPKVKQLKKTILTLVALLAVTTGAWADETPLVTIENVDNGSFTSGSKTFDDKVTVTFSNSVYNDGDTDGWYGGGNASLLTVAGTNGYTITSCKFYTQNGTAATGYTVEGESPSVYLYQGNVFTDANKLVNIGGSGVKKIEVYGTAPSSGTPFAITWSAATPNTASIDKMPAGNVTVSVDYFAQAELAESGAPAAIADVPANTDAPIVTPGTVANIGTSEVKQGTLMYFVSQSTGDTAPEAPDYNTKGWSDKVPTANGLAQGKAYVWYYIKGAEPDNIANRTDANTRSDSDIKPLGTTGFVTLGAEPTYDVSLNKTDLAKGEPALWKAKSTNVAEVNLGEADLEGVKKSETVTVTYSGTKKIIGVKAEPAEEPVTLATPLTIEAITAGTIKVNMTGELSTGMKYSKDGGKTKTRITSSEDIPVAKGDKVQFYGDGTSTQVYYIQNEVSVSINGSGEGFKTKVYGNIMSLLDEEGFATKTELPNNENVFMGLFNTNHTLSDASELLLPATELTPYCYTYMFEGCNNLTTAPKLPATTLASYCYQGMFMNCTSLTTAPKLPATTLAKRCYNGMFNLCSSLTNAYVKAAYTNSASNRECASMFNNCSADGAVLHTTPGDNKASWETVMGTDKDWPNWTVADDWQD